jgi:hypothetical protein
MSSPNHNNQAWQELIQMEEVATVLIGTRTHLEDTLTVLSC